MRTALTLFLLLAMAGLAIADTHYVNMNNSTPVPPYTNWGTAATNIQAAVDAAAAGDLVSVTNGVYDTGGRAVYGTMTNRLAIDKAVTVRSVNGPELTWIVGQGADGTETNNGDGAIRCVYVGFNAVLSGFTLTNGHTRTTGDGYKEQSGGGAYCSANGEITNCYLICNSAYFNGGGTSAGYLNGCTIACNSAYNGGGSYFSLLSNCTLRGNSAKYCGGAYHGTLINCTITDNSAITGGGVSGATLNSCIVTGNSAYDSGGGAFYSTLENCTLSGNAARWEGGGAYDGTLNNCIAFDNASPIGPNYYLSTVAFSCTQPLAPGTGNIDADPLLASITHISAQSPCIGRGKPASAWGVDIDGEAWLNPPCMGADQFIAAATDGELTVDIIGARTNVCAGLSVPIIAQITGRLTASFWDFGDGVVVSNRPYANHAWAQPGLYEVRLTGYNNNFPGGVTATVLVHVAQQETYYVNGANPMPVFPYTNWAGAARDIQDAVDAGTQIGRLVRVTNGVYASGGRPAYGAMSNRVLLPEYVEVRSENGPSGTFIVGQPAPGTLTNGDGAMRCAWVGRNAILNGFTLTNGHTRVTGDEQKEQSGGAAWCEASGVLTNCILRQNSASRYAGGAMDGILNNCGLSGNSAAYGGGAKFATLNSCNINLNSATYSGGGVYFAALHNCSVTGNSAGYGAGGSSGGILDNCIVYYNSGPTGNYDNDEITLNYCCTTPLPILNGSGNLTNEPLFVDTNGWTNLRLQSNSFCINAGSNDYVTGTRDLDGRPRIFGAAVDMGAFEYQGASTNEYIAWLQQQGLPTDGSADCIDSDGDGLNNWQEWRAGTDPTDSLSCLRLLAPVPTGANVALKWQSVTNLSYFLERSTNSSGPQFLPLATNITGLGGTNIYFDTNSPTTQNIFYRLGVGN